MTSLSNMQTLTELLHLAEKVTDTSVKFWLESGQIRFFATNMAYQKKQARIQVSKKKKELVW